MMTSILEQKTAIRQLMLKRRAEQTREQRHTAALDLVRHAPAILKLAAGSAISGFTPFRDEIDPLPLLQALTAAGALLTMPRVSGSHLTFHAWKHGDALVRGRYGQPEPEAHRPERRPGLLLVPLLAFDSHGNRLGYGAGFFDRVIADYQTPLTIGVAYAMQQVDEIPVESHDQSLNYVMTPQGLIDCASASGE